MVLFIYITRPASNEIFSPSNKIHWEVGRAKDLSAPLYKMKFYGFFVHVFVYVNAGRLKVNGGNIGQLIQRV